MATGFAVLANMATAMTEAKDIRMLLDDGEVASLESLFSQLHSSALASDDFSEVRRLVYETMTTTHDTRIETINSWVATYPESPYARAAAAQMRLHIAFLYRGTKSSAITSSLALERFREQIELAIKMADEAFSLAPDYLPASDLVMASSVAGQTDLRIDDLVGHVFSIIPNRKTLKNALYALQPAWGGSFSAMVGLCTQYADQIPNYDTDLCIVEAILENGNYVSMDARKIALEIAETRQGQLSDRAFLAALLDPSFPVVDGMAKLAAELNEMSLGRFSDLSEHTRQSRALELKYSWPGYRQQASNFRIAYIKRRLDDDPFNSNFLKMLANNILFDGAFQGDGRYMPTPEELKQLWQYWKKQKRYGQFRPEYWEAGGRIAQSEARIGQKAFVAFPFYSNAIDMSPIPIGPLSSLLYLFNNDYGSAMRNKNSTNDPELPIAELVLDYTTCEFVRVARVFQAYCSNAHASVRECQRTAGSLAASALSDLEMFCPKVANAPVVDLMYSQIPEADFLNWKLAYAPGN